MSAADIDRITTEINTAERQLKALGVPTYRLVYGLTQKDGVDPIILLYREELYLYSKTFNQDTIVNVFDAADMDKVENFWKSVDSSNVNALESAFEVEERKKAFLKEVEAKQMPGASSTCLFAVDDDLSWVSPACLERKDPIHSVTFKGIKQPWKHSQIATYCKLKNFPLHPHLCAKK